MKIVWILTLVILLMSPVLAAELPEKPQSGIKSQAAFKVPAGWSEYAETILGEPVLTLSRGLYTI